MDSIILLKDDIALLYESNSIMAFIFIGIAIDIFYNIIHCFIDYIYNKTWLINDYEQVIYHCTDGDLSSFDDNFKEIILNARSSYLSRINAKEKRKDFFNKLKEKFKR